MERRLQLAPQLHQRRLRLQAQLHLLARQQARQHVRHGAPYSFDEAVEPSGTSPAAVKTCLNLCHLTQRSYFQADLVRERLVFTLEPGIFDGFRGTLTGPRHVKGQLRQSTQELRELRRCELCGDDVNGLRRLRQGLVHPLQQPRQQLRRFFLQPVPDAGLNRWPKGAKRPRKQGNSYGKPPFRG